MHTVGENNEYVINTNSVVGKGNYGIVYGCYCKNNSQVQLCAKITQIYSDNNSNKEQQEKNIRREKQITEIVQRNKDNQNLVQVQYVKYDKDTSKLIVIMEKCASNLDKEWKEINVYQEAMVIDFLSQFLNGYKALYESNVIHRDIKPENILIQNIDGQKFYRLADFGIGRICKINDFKLTKAGTPFYASPELNSLIQDSELDNKFGLMKQDKQKSVSDVYSLGILLHQLVMGGYPCETTPTGIRQFMNKIKVDKFKLNARINPKLADLIERMIVYNPQERMTFDTLYEECNRFTMMRLPVARPVFKPIMTNPNSAINPQPFLPKPPQINSQQILPNQILFVNQPSGQGIITIQPSSQGIITNQPSGLGIITNQPSGQGLITNQPPGQGIITPQLLLNTKEEICNYLKKILKIHKNTLSPQSIKCFEDFILERTPLSEIGNLYNNFDKTLTYTPEEMQFYYCLKYGMLGQQQITRKQYEDQKRDLSN
ncbi:unnamed protein product [Paramecium octaurelia]|uniref:Protein kinase domain-containing protein n=1 Tax=Paramecium octaurelia TaxID=43137 RepID=A0A8S1TSQ2_PAROT|nr:unnamed protein product [Paramecium octaurelia]